MAIRCPNCGSAHVQRCEVVHNAGTHRIRTSSFSQSTWNYTGESFGSDGSYTTSSGRASANQIGFQSSMVQTELARLVAPPQRKSFLPSAFVKGLLLLGIGSPVILMVPFFIVVVLPIAAIASGKYVLQGIAGIAVLLWLCFQRYKVVQRWNEQWELDYANWRNRWLCSACGNTFIPK